MSEDLAALLAGLDHGQREQLRKLLENQSPVLSQAEVVQPINVSGGYVGQIVAKAVYGRDAEEDEQRQLGWYLASVAARLYRLPLRGLDEQLGRGDGVAMPHVYITLATAGRVEVARGRSEELQQYYRDGKLTSPLKQEFDPAFALPDQAIVQQEGHTPRNNDGHRVLFRARLVTEAVASNRCLTLLGDPGSGKSTAVNYLTWAIAQIGLGDPEAPVLNGCAADSVALPIRLPLRTLAGRIETDGARPSTIYHTLRDEMRECSVAAPDSLLSAALSSGRAILFFDGLDEVPLQRVAGRSADRHTVLRAVGEFMRQYEQAKAVVTCRTRAFDETLAHELGWPVERLSPLTLGQVRFFVQAWYQELAAKGQITRDQAARLGANLINAIVHPHRLRLRMMAETPLLLTLMAIVLYNKNELPRDRPQLYERILELLLGQWDQVHDGESLGQALGQADWSSERIVPLLDRLSYQAHADTASEDGRGRLRRAAVYEALIGFFTAAGVPEPFAAAGRCLEYINHRSGLLIPDNAQDSYVFAHLTLQEHCAGRYLLINRDALSHVMQHRHDDRWREPILLGLGVVQPTNPFLIETVLRRLISRHEDGHAKAPATWYRDLIFAAEVGKDRDWNYLHQQNLDTVGLQAELRSGLAALLSDPSQPLPLTERLRAGQLLGDLGDPRFPVTPEQWRGALKRRSERFGQPEGYFCYVRPGTYRIGGWKERQESADVTLPAFWIARFPVTVAQYAPFVAQGYKAPLFWKQEDYNGANQPVITVSWRDATAFCAWLTEQLHAALPPGYVIRLPTEAEWEVAAAYDAQGQPCSYPWGEAELTPERAIYAEAQVGHPAPVGCCPAGAAACGALDMVGNVWEVTTSDYQNYPQQSGVVQKVFTDDRVPWRGGSWYDNSSYVHCSARVWFHFGHWNADIYGFRVVAAPQLGT